MALFSPDSPFMRFVDRLMDVLLLNLLWLVTSIPLVTIGAATAAAHAVTMKMADDRETYVVRMYFKAFRENLVQGTILWILELGVAWMVWMDWQMVAASEDPPFLLITAGIVTLVAGLVAFVYAWPQVARYRNSLPRILLNSLRIAMRFPLRTLILFVVLGIEVFVFTFTPLMMIIGVLIGPMVAFYTVGGMALRMFQVIERTHNSSKDPPPDHPTAGTF